MTYAFLILALSCNAAANILMKLAAPAYVDGLREWITQPWLLLKNGYLVSAIIFFITALGLYSYVLSKMNLSIAYPIMTSLGFMIVISYSMIFLDEKFFWWQWIGALLIVIGVVLLSQSSAS